MNLTPRLKAVADFVEKGSRIADIGTDHGYAAVYIVENEMADAVFASDINQGPVDNALRTVSECGFSDKVDVRLGGGLLPYTPGEINSVIIAGMGGLLIRDILIESPAVVEQLDYMILQPQIAQDELRQWLLENGFAIVDETLTAEGNRYYEILKVKKGTMTVEDPIQYEVGFHMLKAGDSLSISYVEKKIRTCESIIKSIETKGSEESRSGLSAVEERLRKLKEVRACL